MPALDRVRMFSMTTWIIIICAAVYIIGGFMKPQGAALQNPRSWTLTGLEIYSPAYLATVQTVQEIGRDQWAKLSPQQRSNEVTARISVWEQAIAAHEAGKTQYVPPLNQPPQQIRQIASSTFGAERDLFANGKRIGVASYQSMSPLKRWGFFSTTTAIIGLNAQGNLVGAQFWRFITFQFLHADFWHVFMNMFGLWIFGPLVERQLGRKRFLAFYLLCGIFGAFLYLMLNFTGVVLSSYGMDAVPFLLPNDPHVPLIGASAGVFGVLFAGAYLAPNMTVLLFFLIPIRLVTLAYGLVIFALLTLWTNGSNAGGEAAHLGGALAGFYFIRRQHHLHGFFDFLGRVDPTSRSAKAKRVGAGSSNARRAVDDAEIDRILAKIHAKGLNSLTSKEKRILRDSSKR